MVCPETGFRYYLVPVKFHFSEVDEFPRSGSSPGFRGLLKFLDSCCQELVSLDDLSHYDARLAQLRYYIESRVCKHADRPRPHEAGSLAGLG